MSFGSYQQFNPSANMQGGLAGLAPLLNNVASPSPSPSPSMPSGPYTPRPDLGPGVGFGPGPLPGAPQQFGQPPSTQQQNIGQPQQGQYGNGKSAGMMPGSIFGGGGKSFGQNFGNQVPQQNQNATQSFNNF